MPNNISRFISIFFLTIFISTQALATSCFKEANTLSVCSYSEFKPTIYANGEGYEGDLLRAITKYWKIKLKFYPEKIYEGMWRHPSREYTRCDIAAGGFTPMQSRENEGALFSTKTANYKQSLLVRRKDYENKTIVSYDSFKNSNRKIGVVAGTSGEEYAHIRAKEACLNPTVFVQYSDETKLLEALQDGKIDAIARGELGNDYQASIDNTLVSIAKRNFNDGFAFVIDSSNKLLVSKLNSAINLITEHGKIGFQDWLKNHNVFMERVNKIGILKTKYCNKPTQQKRKAYHPSML